MHYFNPYFVHRLVGGLLSLSPDYGFVLEDDEGICGYALGTADVSPFIKKCKLSWIPFMQEKYLKPEDQEELTEAEVKTLILFQYLIWNKPTPYEYSWLLFPCLCPSFL